MAIDTTRTVSVILAAHDASASLVRAIRSACAEPETAQVIVIDDASSDDTRAIALQEAGRDTRVNVIALDTNVGPGAARNKGLDAATAPFAAILDLDDFFLPGRLSRLMSAGRCDIAADNIVFTNPESAGSLAERDWSRRDVRFQSLDTESFVAGNLRRRGIARGELGFLKPILSTAFLNAHGLRYDESLRLGEDYDLYVRMLLAGASMMLTSAPGYAAEIRSGSLSARHRTADLERLHDALTRHLATPDLAPGTSKAMRAHLAEVRIKRDHRLFLDLKRERGPIAALRYAFGAWNRPAPITRAIARDKLRLDSAAGDALPQDGMRLLLPDAAFSQET